MYHKIKCKKRNYKTFRKKKHKRKLVSMPKQRVFRLDIKSMTHKNKDGQNILHQN